VHGRYFAAGSWVFRGARPGDSQRTLGSEFQSRHPHKMRSMAYLSLYRKYRPQTFDEILGQEHVSRTLANAIAEDRVAHAYLFTGPRGTGKTSTARILAKALNCEQGPTPTPCGKCEACIAIAEGSSLDVIEMDAASHSKVDETREILAGVPLATAGGRRKVYVIDEVHMLSTGSFNALLKTLEEPPGHVVFVLATTEAHKVLHTIVSRTQRFDFRPVPSDVLHKLLEEVAAKEGIRIENAAVGVLARHAEGSARDALSVLDQLSSTEGTVTADDAERLLGQRGEDAFIALFDAVASGDLGSVFWSVHSLVAQGTDVRQLAIGALGHARSLLLLRTAPDAEELLDVSSEDRASLAAQAERFTTGRLISTMDLIGKSLTEMRNAPNHRLLLEVALVRACAPETDPGATGLLSRIERIERRMGIEGPAPEPAPEPAATVTASPPPRREKPTTDVPQPAAPPVREAKVEPADEPSPPAPAGEVGFGHVKDAWPATLREVGKRSKRVGAFLNPSRPVRFDGDQLVVQVQSEFHVGEMSESRNRDMLTDALHASLGIRPHLAFATQGGEAQSSSEGDPEDLAEARPDDRDPIEIVKEGLGAEVVEER
jgi:DNA polymerase-3 subunit gamma/tau